MVNSLSLHSIYFIFTSFSIHTIISLCHIRFNNFQGLLIGGSIIYYFPMIMIGSISFYFMHHMCQTKNVAIQQSRQRTDQRDVVVLRRIIILVGILFFLSFSIILLWLGYLITCYYLSFRMVDICFLLINSNHGICAFNPVFEKFNHF